MCHSAPARAASHPTTSRRMMDLFKRIIGGAPTERSTPVARPPNEATTAGGPAPDAPRALPNAAALQARTDGAEWDDLDGPPAGQPAPAKQPGFIERLAEIERQARAGQLAAPPTATPTETPPQAQGGLSARLAARTEAQASAREGRLQALREL